ncbi:ATP-grasp domain-containing protein [Kitasatospora sp. NPDC054939]
MPAPVILFPADPLNPGRTDPHFAWEARLLRELGGSHLLVDHDALLAGDVEAAVRRVPLGCGPCWYRGWMVPSPAYAALAAALERRGATMLTSAAGYASAHELPGWYGVFEGATPASTWLPADRWTAGLPDPADLAAAAARLGGRGPAVVKDYVKSRKHEWDEACYVPDLADPAALGRVVSRFVELQGEFLTGGVVLRRFERFAGAGRSGGSGAGAGAGTGGAGTDGAGTDGAGTDGAGTDGAGTDGAGTHSGAGTGRAAAGDRSGAVRAAEARVWWLDGEPILVGPHPDTPGRGPEPDLTDVRPLVRALGCRFVTTDLALRADAAGDADPTPRNWRVVEVGDGQVSELPRGIDATGLLASLIAA